MAYLEFRNIQLKYDQRQIFSGFNLEIEQYEKVLFCAPSGRGKTSLVKMLLGFVVLSEIRGDRDSVAFRRRICPDVQRQAVAVALTAVGVVSLALLVLASFVKAPVERIMFEVISAFATAGLSTGLTAQMPPAGQMIIILVMYVGRVGIISLAAILAVPSRFSPIRYPEEKPIVG